MTAGKLYPVRLIYTGLKTQAFVTLRRASFVQILSSLKLVFNGALSHLILIKGVFTQKIGIWYMVTIMYT